MTRRSLIPRSESCARRRHRVGPLGLLPGLCPGSSRSRGSSRFPTRELRPCVTSAVVLGRTLARSRRERMSSLLNTLRRCHSTVRGLRNSRAPISGFESPSRASRAICRSCAVRSSRVSAARLRTFSPVAESSLRARSANASIPISTSISWAARSCSRASTRRFSRRNHSP